jgi:hypothetical protein
MPWVKIGYSSSLYFSGRLSWLWEGSVPRSAVCYAANACKRRAKFLSVDGAIVGAARQAAAAWNVESAVLAHDIHVL